jgi:hypothetical protein
MAFSCILVRTQKWYYLYDAINQESTNIIHCTIKFLNANIEQNYQKCDNNITYL